MGDNARVRVLVVEDHLLFAEAIRVTLADMEMDVVGLASTGAQAVDEDARLRPDLVLLDLGLPDRYGLSVGADILATRDDVKVVVLTGSDEGRSIQEAQRLGFHGYLTKQTPVDQFKRSVLSVLDGQTVFPHRVGRTTRSGDRRDADLMAAQLTRREEEVLQLLAEGASGDQIAARLGVSHNTVRTHVQGILSKLQVHSRLEAAAFAVRHDLVKVRAS